jgi:hypothetical protein
MTPEQLLAEFKLSTGKGQLIRANEMAARLFAHLIEADQTAAAQACDPAQCPCRTAKAKKTASLDSLVTHRDTTATTTITVPGDLVVTGNVTMGSYSVGLDAIAENITPYGYVELSNEAVPLGDGSSEHPLFGPIPDAVPINTQTLEVIDEIPASKSRKKK